MPNTETEQPTSDSHRRTNLTDIMQYGSTYNLKDEDLPVYESTYYLSHEELDTIRSEQ